MGIKQKLENMVNRWLFSEEIAQHEQQEASGIVPRPQQNRMSEADMEEEGRRLQKIHEEQVALIKAEDHSNAPSDGDIKRYYQYHVNMVENIHMIERKTGQKPPFPVPSEPLTEQQYKDMAGRNGWKGMRMSCGLPTGDLSKPKKPWTMADGEKKWTVEDKKETPEIHWKTKE